MEARGAKERDLEQVDKAMKRVRDRVDTLAKSVRTLERVTTQLCER